MALLTELDSVSAAIAAEFPESTIKYEVPEDPKPDTFVIRAQRSEFETANRFMMRIGRDLQIMYYSDDLERALTVMDALAVACMGGQTVIPLVDDTLRFIRIESFSYTHPARTQNNLFAASAIMPVEIRQARDQQVYQKIMQVFTRFTVQR